MRKLFTRQHLAAHCPSFLREIDREEYFCAKGGSREEKSMKLFLQQNGFDMKKINRDGFGFSTDEMGNVVLADYRL
jgi:hypothetical protein